ncbi:hypothetical protein ACLKA7_008670 [Drosophila subpalustris]
MFTTSVGARRWQNLHVPLLAHTRTLSATSPCHMPHVEASLASLWPRLVALPLLLPLLLHSVLCFLMSCHVLYEMSSASALPKMVGSVPASGVGGNNSNNNNNALSCQNEGTNDNDKNETKRNE